MESGELGAKALELGLWHLASLYGGYRDRGIWEGVETFCLFIGYPRSGHSLVGALLDAHPDMVIAHELNVLKCLYARLSWRQIAYLIIRNARVSAAGGRRWNDYSYEVPNQWQGRFRRIRVLGDKKGGGSTWLLRSNPELLDRLRRKSRKDLRVIHVVRNPFDNISSIHLKQRSPSLDLRQSINYYFFLCDSIAGIKRRLTGGELLEVRLESFIADPENGLRALCRFLGTEAPEDYLHDCAGIVFRSRKRTRRDVEWKGALTGAVQERMAEYPFLAGYGFDG